ncbi:MAG: hypothetical protein M3235_12985 [Actinomycetota bacterium]|nr:hypothetical protein [Actinomycetota bacterium]
MLRSSVDWMGNRVDLQEIEGTGLTVLQWCRPWNGALRGARVLAADEVHRMSTAVAEAAAGTRAHPRLEGVAGRPLDLASFLVEVLDGGADAAGSDPAG